MQDLGNKNSNMQLALNEFEHEVSANQKSLTAAVSGESHLILVQLGSEVTD
jgi:hypothetical protein